MATGDDSAKPVLAGITGRVRRDRRGRPAEGAGAGATVAAGRSPVVVHRRGLFADTAYVEIPRYNADHIAGTVL